MYEKLLKSFGEDPRDVHTVPLDKGRIPVWFYTYADNGVIYVESGRDHAPESRITGRHRLDPAETEIMLELYHRRKRGESVSQEASKATMCQVYWYGVFANLNL